MYTFEKQMPTAAAILSELQHKGTAKARDMYVRHGAQPGRVLGASVAQLKEIAKTIKGQQDLALELYRTGMMDAMYLAGMVANGSRMSTDELNAWAAGGSVMPMVSEYTVPWVTLENPHGRELATQWIHSPEAHVAAAGWCTYGGLVATKPDADLDLAEVERLLGEVVKGIGDPRNRVRYTMNGFVIAVGVYVKPLLKQAKAAASKIGAVSVETEGTACRVPLAMEAIEKAAKLGRTGRKRKTMRC